MRRRRIGKALERAARTIKDADDFVQHIGNIAERYRREHALDAGLRGSALRQSLKHFHKHSQALQEWIDRACVATKRGVDADALDTLAGALDRAPGEMRAEAKQLQDWLSQAGSAARRSLADMKSSRRSRRDAPRIAAEGLRATFEHHQLNVSTAGTKERPSAVVSLLCAIAKSAGDASLTLAEAKRAVVVSGKPRSAP